MKTYVKMQSENLTENKSYNQVTININQANCQNNR